MSVSHKRMFSCVQNKAVSCIQGNDTQARTGVFVAQYTLIAIFFDYLRENLFFKFYLCNQ
jgi:hypothetical protein